MLAGIAALALAIRIVVARSYPNVLWADEIFQTLEQAHRVVFGYGVIPWEFRVGARSWILPGVLAGVMAATQHLGAGSSGYLLGVAVFLCLVSLIPVVVAFALQRGRAGSACAVVAALAVAGWFELVFFAPKALNEAVAAHVMVGGLYLVATARERPRRAAAAGLLLGLAIVLRLQLAPVGLLALSWLLRTPRRLALDFAAGAAIAVLVAGLVDALSWGGWFSSYASYWRVNVLERRSEQWGIAPWFAYLTTLARNWSAGTLLVLPLALLGARRQPLFALAALVVIAAHSIPAHKEYQFVYPAIVCLILLAGLGMSEILGRVGGKRRRVAAAGAALAVWFALSFALAARFDASQTNLTPNEERGWHFTRLVGPLSAMESLSRRADLCGVGLGLHWSQTGGYAYLHRNVPIVQLSSPEELNRIDGPFNAMVASAELAQVGLLESSPFRQEACWADGMCLYVRTGPCSRGSEGINAALRARGE